MNTIEAEEERRRKLSDGADMSDKSDGEAGYVTAALVAERKREKAFACALAEAKEAASAMGRQLDKIEKTLDALKVMLALGDDEEAGK